jgi:O-acetyl-ADP-ribose deacetylase (regulator of RNase III)
MHLILCAVKSSLAEAWTQFCGNIDFVTVHHGSILDVECDVVVSPANSYGFMDGGIDAVYMDYFGSNIQLKVRRQILDYHHGELLVGAADIVETDDDKIPYLIAAPTMRVPMVLYNSVNAYIAARAVFILVTKGIFTSGRNIGQNVSEHIKTVAMPGLGTGVGNIAPKVCAHQVRSAINDILLCQYTMPKSWAEASENHQLLYTNQLKRLQF